MSNMCPFIYFVVTFCDHTVKTYDIFSQSKYRKKFDKINHSFKVKSRFLIPRAFSK